MRYGQRLSLDEIAKEFKITKSGVKAYLHCLRRTLGECIERKRRMALEETR
jgi:DNA-directed RNA polymerase specialized sigma24 family protein